MERVDWNTEFPNILKLSLFLLTILQYIILLSGHCTTAVKAVVLFRGAKTTFPTKEGVRRLRTLKNAIRYDHTI